MRTSSQGFTLIEIMIVVAIVAILAAIAIPSYRDYIQRGKIVTAINNLGSLQSAMEQFYQDNRTYQDANGFTSPCDSASGIVYTTKLTDWAFTCPSWGTSTYTVQAAGKTAISSGFIYQVNQSGTQSTIAVGTGWPALTSAASGCFITKKGMTC